MSSEYNVESIVILILQPSPNLPPAVHYDSTTDTVSALERLVVKCSPKTAFFPARALFLKPVLWQAVLTVEYQCPEDVNAATYDGRLADIDTAITNTPPAAAVTQALLDFPLGMGIDIVDGGDKQPPGNDTRNYTRTYKAWWRES